MPYSEHSATQPPSAKRTHLPPRSSKACNTCRKQKARCEQLAGDDNSCHRCSVLGISCVFRPDPITKEAVKERRLRALQPRATQPNVNHGRSSPPNVAHRSPASSPSPSFQAAPPPVPFRSKTPLSPRVLSSVLSTLHLSEDPLEQLKFRSDWRRWVAPLTMLKLECCSPPSSNQASLHASADAASVSPSEARRLKDHFIAHYVPWMPSVSLFSSTRETTFTPFLTTVIHVTAARTCPVSLSSSTIQALRAHALHHVGQILTKPTAYPLLESLYALLVLIMWPLESASDVTLLVHVAKRMAQRADEGRLDLTFGLGPDYAQHVPPDLSPQDGDVIRLWYAICANETIFSLSAGNTTTPPPMTLLTKSLGTASTIALKNGSLADTLLVLRASLHQIIVNAINVRSFDRGARADGGPSSTPPTLEARQAYVTKISSFLSKLAVWEIEFMSIQGQSPPSSHIHFAILEIEYHYLTLVYIVHTMFIIVHTITRCGSLGDLGTAMWGWTILQNKASHRMFQLWNTFSKTYLTSHVQLPSLTFSPDRIYAMLVIGAMVSLRHQIVMRECAPRDSDGGVQQGGFTPQTELAMKEAVQTMGSFGFIDGGGGGERDASEDRGMEHPAVRYAEVLEALLRVWEERKHVAMDNENDQAGDGRPAESTAIPESGHDDSQQYQQPSSFSQLQLPESLPLLSYPSHSDSHSQLLPTESLQIPSQPQYLDTGFGFLGIEFSSDMAAMFPNGAGSFDWGFMGMNVQGVGVGYDGMDGIGV